jgi:hypothetical protein
MSSSFVRRNIARAKIKKHGLERETDGKYPREGDGDEEIFPDVNIIYLSIIMGDSDLLYFGIVLKGTELIIQGDPEEQGMY